MTNTILRRCFFCSVMLVTMFGVALAAGFPPGGEEVTPTFQPAAGSPMRGLSPALLQRFQLGRVRFDRDFLPFEGLGPIFNQTSCGDCHSNPLGGTGSIVVFRAARDDKQGFDPLEDLGGSLFQLESISPECAELTPPPEATVETNRVTNGMMGYGLIEAIPHATILATETDQAANNPSIAGIAHDVTSALTVPCPPLPPSGMPIGRFGWKAQVADILTFSADASLNEIGLTNRIFAMDNDPNGVNPPSLGAPDNCDTVADPEDNLSFGDGVSREFIDVVTDFQRFMVQPPQTPKSGMTGEDLFNTIGCNQCHVRTYATSTAPCLEPILQGRIIKPYSDLLLHFMGLNGDPIVQGEGLQRWMKTPPLWGVRLRPALWHDGRFQDPTRIRDAIEAHDDGINLSQGRFAAQGFAALSAPQQDAVLAFMNSLGRREFDFVDDDLIRLDDFHGGGDPAAFAQCYGGGPYSPDAACALHDVDQDTDVDDVDFLVFLQAYVGPLSDCNGNEVLDLAEILANSALDADNNGLLDSCEPTCPGDTDGNGVAGIDEFLDLFASWGPCDDLPAPCPSDLNFDGTVGVDDMLALFVAWGPCP